MAPIAFLIKNRPLLYMAMQDLTSILDGFLDFLSSWRFYIQPTLSAFWINNYFHALPFRYYYFSLKLKRKPIYIFILISIWLTYIISAVMLINMSYNRDVSGETWHIVTHAGRISFYSSIFLIFIFLVHKLIESVLARKNAKTGNPPPMGYR